MATSTTGLSSPGIGSGLDVKSLVTSLMNVEKQPLQQMQSDASALNAKLSSYGKLQSYVSALGDAANKLASTTTWGQAKAASASDASVGAAVSGTPVQGSYSVQVNALAAGQVVASGAFADTAAAAGMSGSMRIEMGQWSEDGTSFTPTNYPSFIDVAISSSDSVEAIRDKINASGAGVTASIVKDSSGSRLIVRSNATGAVNGFRLNVSDDDGNATDANGLSSLGFDPLAGQTSMSRTKEASDASISVDGLTVTGSTNTFDGVVPGLSFNAKAVTTTPVDVTVSNDTTATRANVDAFVKAYNDLASYLSDQTKYDATTKTAGTLQGDSGTNALRSALRTIGSANAGSSAAFNRLTQIGLDPQKDGTLKVDDAKLNAALARPAEMAKIFGGGDPSTTDDDGFASKLATWASSLTGFDGAISTRQASLQSQIDANTKKQGDFQTRLDGIQARLTAQYSALDTQMAQMNTLSTYLAQQITNWNKSSG